MSELGTVTQVERVRVKTRDRGKHVTLHRLEHDFRDLNSLLFVSALRARQASIKLPPKFIPSVNDELFNDARRDVQNINIAQLSMNSPLQAIFEQIATGAAGAGTLGALVLFYNRVLASGKKTLGFYDQYQVSMTKRSDTKVYVARNKLVENELRHQLRLQEERHKIRGRIVEGAVGRTRFGLSEAKRKELDRSIVEGARALTIIESIEIEDAP